MVGKDHDRDEVTLERLERALAAISYAILLDGPIYAPVLDRLEREIAALRASEDVVSRARQHLQRLRDQAAASVTSLPVPNLSRSVFVKAIA
jgi:hypothetical protein